MEWQGSPGHLEGLEDLFETIEIEAVDSVTLSVYIGSSLQSKAVGVALIDLSERTIFVLEFLDTDHFTNFEVCDLSLSRISVSLSHDESFKIGRMWWCKRRGSRNVCYHKTAKTLI